MDQNNQGSNDMMNGMRDPSEQGTFVPPVQVQTPQPAPVAPEPIANPVPPVMPRPVTPPNFGMQTPPFVPPSQTGTPSFTPPQKPKKGFLMTVILAVFILLILGGAGAAAYYFYFSKTTSSDPKTILKNAFENKLPSDSASMDLAITVNVKSVGQGGPQLDKFLLTLNVVGDADSKDKENTKAALDITATLSAASSDLGSVDGSIKVGTIAVNKEMFFSVKDFSLSVNEKEPNISTATMVGFAQGFVNGIKGKWIKGDQRITSTTDTLPKVIEEDISKRVARLDYVKSIESKSAEKIAGIDTEHLVVHLDSAKTMELLRDVAILMDSANSAEYNLEDLKGMSVGTSGKDTIDFEFWIGKSDSRIYRIKSTDMEIKELTSGAVVAFSMDMKISNYGKEFNITAPTEFTTLEALINSLNPSPTPAPKKAR